MNKLNYAVAMLTVGGLMGVADRAAAGAVYIDTLDISVDTPLEQITILGSTPEFDYGSVDGGFFTEFGTDYFLNGGTQNSGVGAKSSSPGLPSPGETYSADQSYLTAVPKDEGELILAPDYIHLTFDYDGVGYIGTAHVDAAGTLETIEYTAVPEPEAWALLIAGAAMVGGGLRRSRRRQSLAIS